MKWSLIYAPWFWLAIIVTLPALPTQQVLLLVLRLCSYNIMAVIYLKSETNILVDFFFTQHDLCVICRTIREFYQIHCHHYLLRPSWLNSYRLFIQLWLKRRRLSILILQFTHAYPVCFGLAAGVLYNKRNHYPFALRGNAADMRNAMRRAFSLGRAAIACTIRHHSHQGLERLEDVAGELH